MFAVCFCGDDGRTAIIRQVQLLCRRAWPTLVLANVWGMARETSNAARHWHLFVDGFCQRRVDGVFPVPVSFIVFRMDSRIA